MRLVALVLVGALSSVAPAAGAEPPEPGGVAAPSPTTTHFYGWQNLVVAYGGAAVAIRGAWIQSPLMVGTGAVTWCFGGAVVHGLHGNHGAAIASPFIQVGVPALFYVIGSMAAGDRWDKEENGAFGAILGVLGAPVIDALLGRERLEKPRSMALAPSVERGRVGLNLVGAF